MTHRQRSWGGPGRRAKTNHAAVHPLVLGVAFGLVVRSMGAVKSIGAGFKALRQGEVTQYTELLEDWPTARRSSPVR
jgi:hypothetical protein